MVRFSKVVMIVLFCTVFVMLSSCTPAKYFFLNSEGIVTYNRHTGQFEMLWDAKTGHENPSSGVVFHDTVYVDKDTVREN